MQKKFHTLARGRRNLNQRLKALITIHKKNIWIQKTH